jgi:SAM-dependent methyltransferase
VRGSLPAAQFAKLRARLCVLNEQAFRGIASSAAHIAQMTDDSLDEERSLEQLNLFQRETGVPLEGCRLLEIGAGIGLTVAMARKRFGARSYGVEPGADEYGGASPIAADLLAAYGLPRYLVVQGVGEHLPFHDGSFNVVISSNVLEHVANPRQVVAEALRVLAPGGFLQFVVPNYGSWWEGHYGILWFPHLPAILGKFYVRLLRRNPAYLDTLQLVTAGKLRRWLRVHRSQLEILGWGEQLWEERVRRLEFTEYAALGRLKELLRIAHRLRLVNALVRVGRSLHWETPIILTARKRGH